MHAIQQALLLACSTWAGLGRRVQERGESVQGRFHTKHETSQKESQSSGRDRVPRPWNSIEPFELLFSGFDNPSAAWKLNSPSGELAQPRPLAVPSRTQSIISNAVSGAKLRPLKLRVKKDVAIRSPEDKEILVAPGTPKTPDPLSTPEMPERQRHLRHGPKLPRIAIVGSPNVGKSTIANWMTGKDSQKSMVFDRPGITRDRVYGEGCWKGQNFTVIDTGGLFYHDKDHFDREVREQTKLAVQEADLVLFIADGDQGLTMTDEECADMLREHRVPAVLAINKCDNEHEGELQSSYFWELGMGTPMPVSALHKKGLSELMDELVKLFPPEPEAEDVEAANTDVPEVRVAILGRPNVGKSSLLNNLLGEDRLIVSDIAGSTRDTVRHSIFYNGTKFSFIDTAGVRPKAKVRKGIEERTVRRSLQAVREQADVCMLVIDAIQGLTTQESFFARFIIQSGLPSLVVVNKWDLVKDKAKLLYGENKKKKQFPLAKQLPKVTRNKGRPLYISAKTGQNTDEIFNAVLALAEKRKDNKAETKVVEEEEEGDSEMHVEEDDQLEIEEIEDNEDEEQDEHEDIGQHHEPQEVEHEQKIELDDFEDLASSVKFDSAEW